MTFDDVVTMLLAEAAISANVRGRWSDGITVWTMARERERITVRVEQLALRLATAVLRERVETMLEDVGT